MELLQYWKIIQKNALLIGAILVLGLGLMTAYTITRPLVYESSATVLLNSPVSDPSPYFQNQMASSLADTYTARMQTRAFADEVVKELPSASVSQVLGSIRTYLKPNTFFFTIVASADTAEQAQKLASAVVKVFLSSDSMQGVGPQQGVDSVKQELRGRFNSILESLRGQITAYQQKITTIEALPPTKEQDDQLLQLRSQLVTLQQTEAQTLGSVVQLGDGAAKANAIIIDQPLPGRQLERKLLSNLILAGILATVLGVGLAFLLNYIDYTIHSAEQLEEIQGLTPLAVIGAIDTSSKRTYTYGRFAKQKAGESEDSKIKPLTNQLITRDNARSPASESFRVLRTNIQFSSIEKPIQSLVVTSAQPGEGKSFTASNLAVVMAQAGKRVILVDTDLRKPSQHKVFQLPNISGFSNLISDRTTDIDAVTQSVPGVDNLAVITSGVLPPNPAELLNSHQALDVMAQLAQRADVVIYDAPPVGAVTDPVILATRTDAVLLVIASDITRRDAVTRAVKSLQKVGTKTLLPVLNRVKAKDMQGYYYYQYYGSDTPKQESPLNGSGVHINGKVVAVGSANGSASDNEVIEVMRKPAGRRRS